MVLPPKTKCLESTALKPVRVEFKASYCPYKLHKIGFNIEIQEHKQFVEAYQVCFDKEYLRPLFTINKAYPVGGGRPDLMKFDTDFFFFGDLFNAFRRDNVFNRFKKLLGDKQKYMSELSHDHIDRGHLTPSGDFSFTNLKHSTFNMMNAIPQFKTINNGNWRLIENWSRKSPTNVCTGVLDCNLKGKTSEELSCILKLKAVNHALVPMYLFAIKDDLKIPIPLWSYKIVKNKKNSVVFLTLNNIYHEGVVKEPSDVCKIIPCPLKLSPDVKLGRTFCCSYNEFIDKNVPRLKGIC